MTSKLIRSGLFAVAAMFVAPLAANAADLPRPSYKAPAYVAPSIPTWSGFYVGLQGGYGFGTSDWGGIVEVEPDGFLVGGTIGYNLQTGSWVWGLEADIAYADITGTTGALETSVSWLGTARGRIGYAGWGGGNLMPYITGGAAFGNLEATAGAVSSKETKIGWTIGGGFEYMMWSNWSLKLEYLYADLGNVTVGPVDVDFNAHIVRAGLNYRF